jgi:tetratricopeptide (TPR) repeat protein
MVDLRPDLGSYSRVSYLRELHGDTAGAMAAMQAALEAAVPGTEAAAWTQTQLGNLYFNDGDWAAADAHYQAVLRGRPDYPYALAGLARGTAARGNLEGAIAGYAPLVERLPLPEFAIALGELEEAAGRRADAERNYDLVRAIQQLNADAGVKVDLELALFEANHGDPAAAVAKARDAYVAPFSQEALRLGTRDALLYYHAGVIAHALEQPAEARRLLSEALAINPAFNLLDAARAREILAELGAANAPAAGR